MNIKINEVLRSYIDPLTEIEFAALERSLLAEGCRDALVLWGDVLIDGHNRYAICRQHGISFKTLQNTSFEAIDDVLLWMIDNHLARRSVSNFQRGVLALRKKDIVSAKIALQMSKLESAPSHSESAPSPLSTREDVAKEARLSSKTIVQIEKIQRGATLELVDAVRSGTISIHAAATISSLSEAQQLSALGGGKKSLQQAAKEIREQRASSRTPREPANGPAEVDVLRAEISALKEINVALKAENGALAGRIAALTDTM